MTDSILQNTPKVVKALRRIEAAGWVDSNFREALQDEQRLLQVLDEYGIKVPSGLRVQVDLNAESLKLVVPLGGSITLPVGLEVRVEEVRLEPNTESPTRLQFTASLGVTGIQVEVDPNATSLKLILPLSNRPPSLNLDELTITRIAAGLLEDTPDDMGCVFL